MEYLDIFFAYKLSILYLLFINGKCEKLPVLKLNIKWNILTLFFAHKLSASLPISYEQ
jgi:hypothetical protein